MKVQLKRVTYSQEFKVSEVSDMTELFGPLHLVMGDARMIDGIMKAQIVNRHGTKYWIDWNTEVDVLTYP